MMTLALERTEKLPLSAPPASLMWKEPSGMGALDSP
jgi:hypothetical protein